MNVDVFEITGSISFVIIGIKIINKTFNQPLKKENTIFFLRLFAIALLYLSGIAFLLAGIGFFYLFLIKNYLNVAFLLPLFIILNILFYIGMKKLNKIIRNNKK